MKIIRRKITTSVPVAGAMLFDLGIWGSYEAAKRGDIPIIQIGRKKRVSVAWMEEIARVGPGDLDDTIMAIEGATPFNRALHPRNINLNGETT